MPQAITATLFVMLLRFGCSEHYLWLFDGGFLLEVWADGIAKSTSWTGKRWGLKSIS